MGNFKFSLSSERIWDWHEKCKLNCLSLWKDEIGTIELEIFKVWQKHHAISINKVYLFQVFDLESKFAWRCHGSSLWPCQMPRPLGSGSPLNDDIEACIKRIAWGWKLNDCLIDSLRLKKKCYALIKCNNFHKQLLFFCQLAGLAQTPGSNSVDFKSEITAKEEIIELQEMRVSPIPSIRNRFGGISRSDFFLQKKEKEIFFASLWQICEIEAVSK